MVSGSELTRLSSSVPPIPIPTTTFFAMKSNSGNVMYMVKNFFASSSDEEDNNTKEAEEFDSPDYEPFMAPFVSERNRVRKKSKSIWKKGFAI